MSGNPLFSLPAGFHAIVVGGAGDIGAAITNLFLDFGAIVTASGVDTVALAHSTLQARDIRLKYFRRYLT